LVLYEKQKTTTKQKTIVEAIKTTKKIKILLNKYEKLTIKKKVTKKKKLIIIWNIYFFLNKKNKDQL